jgi:hypothetical protein
VTKLKEMFSKMMRVLYENRLLNAILVIAATIILLGYLAVGLIIIAIVILFLEGVSK